MKMKTPELIARFLQSLLLTRHPSAELNRNGLKRQKSFHDFVIQIQISMDSWNWFGTVQRTLSSNKVQAGHRQRTWTGTTAPLSHFCGKFPTESPCKLHNGRQVMRLRYRPVQLAMSHRIHPPIADAPKLRHGSMACHCV